MRIERRRHAVRRAAVAVAVGGVVLVPHISDARPVQEVDPADDGGSAVGSGQVDIEIDPLRADSRAIGSAFGDIRDNVLAQRAQLDAAEQAVLQAEAAVAETETELAFWTAESDRVVVEAFMTTPGEGALDALTSATATEATLKQTVLDMEAARDADILAELDATQARLEERQETQRAAVEAAEQALENLQSAVSQQATFVNEVEARLERELGEIEALRESDPELAAELEGQIGVLAVQIAEARRVLEEEAQLEAAGIEPADPGAPTGPVTITVEGGLAVVSCPEGQGSIQVAGVIARDLQGLLNLAAEQGLPLCGSGWRDPAEQVALRRAHCGSSNYAIYQAPASSCSPPTARPGTSMHEQGLAIDFTCGSRGTVSWGDVCHDFLRAHASDFGLHPLPGEPWHWSPDGT